jgi:hypothetical protein
MLLLLRTLLEKKDEPPDPENISDEGAFSRPPVVGRGPGTTTNYTDFYKYNPKAPRPLAVMADKRAAAKRRRRAELEVLIFGCI